MAVRKGGRGMALVKKAGDMFASRDDSTSSTVWIFFKVSQQGTSVSLGARMPAGLNLKGVARLPLPNKPKCSIVRLMIFPPFVAMW